MKKRQFFLISYWTSMFGKLLATLFVAGILVALNSCKKGDEPGFYFTEKTKANVAIDWYRLQTRILLQRNSALLNNASFAFIGTGLYEAVRNEIPHSVSLSARLSKMPAMPLIEEHKRYSWEESANAAMAGMVRTIDNSLTTAELASIDSLEKAWNDRLEKCTSKEVFSRSQNYGRSIASAIYKWSLTDDLNLSNTGYVAPVFEGAWVPTPPAFINPPVLPYAGQAHTLVAANSKTIAPPFPAAYSESPKSSYYKIARELYDKSKHLTDEQKNIALFWFDLGDGLGYTPGGHDMVLTTEALEQTHSCLAIAAETYAKAGIAERDGIIACFKSKYKYTLERPVTYIQKVIEKTWLPFIPTPPHPEYPAAHSAITGSVMEAISAVLGDHVKITDHAYDFRGFAPRTFNSIFAAAEEAGISRLYGGIHYRPSIEAGLKLAKDVGSKVGAIKLLDID